VKKAIIIPYDNEAYHFIKYNNYEYHINGLVSPRGWGLNKKDCGVAAGDQSNGMIVNELNEEFGTILMVESTMDISFEEYIIPKLKELCCDNKEIVVLRKLSEKENELLTVFSNEHNMTLTYFEKMNFNDTDCEELQSFRVPVIFVTGLMEGVRKFDVQLKLRHEMIEKGVQLSQIGTKSYAEFFGFDSFPEFMFDQRLSIREKILMFNNFVKTVEFEQNPDAIIIGVPGELMPISNKIVENFGVMNFMVSKAVTPDSVCVVMPYGDYDASNFEELKHSLKYGFSYMVDSFVISNISLDQSESEEFCKKRLSLIGYDNYQNLIQRYEIGENDKFDIFGVSEKTVSDCIVNALSGSDIREVL